MKIKELANKIDKSKENEDWVDVGAIGSQFNLNIDDIEQDRLKCYWVGNWYCTDTWVGYRIYFLDDIAVAFSIQSARKCCEDIYWFSKELALKVKEYLITLMIQEEDELDISICDIDDEIGDSYKINFNNEILSCNKPTLNGEDVTILERIRYKNDYGIDQELKIRLKNGEEKVVNIKELDFKYYIK